MATEAEQIAALQWAATFRGAADPDEAADWMVVHGLATYDMHDGGNIKLTAEGTKRAEGLLLDLRSVPSSRRAKRRRTNMVLLAVAGVAVWWARRSPE